MHTEHDIAQLEHRISELRQTWKALEIEKDFEELIRTIRRPGWTTPAEYLFALGITDNLIVQARSFGTLKDALLNASRAVSSAKVGTPA